MLCPIGGIIAYMSVVLPKVIRVKSSMREAFGLHCDADCVFRWVAVVVSAIHAIWFVSVSGISKRWYRVVGTSFSRLKN